ncbi:hypothetical protein BGW36DRAFT_387059 [Talaromyces proteolyticus]|uniref:Uncharacterized protein n=1 Tax=Talaromyces proteolyticus TaxID=1131652 RepID=A0AAD4KMX8_9EURO|nr:uncharacterized protein BGW36DRAFT_387059 [Talaromyces proteolyticus]KAH8692132.1 hypothetical protein BGW36DRAFT_387059 [Talaromyces proteolyticus]
MIAGTLGFIMFFSNTILPAGRGCGRETVVTSPITPLVTPPMLSPLTGFIPATDRTVSRDGQSIFLLFRQGLPPVHYGRG